MTDICKRKGRARNKKYNRLAACITAYAVLGFFALLIVVPFYVIVISSLKESHALATNVPFIWWPGFSRLGFRAYGSLFTDFIINTTGKSMVLTGIGNTMLIVIPNTVVGMLASAVSAYSFAKIKFRGKNLMFAALMFSMMLPSIITLIPSYLIFDSLGLTNTYFPLMAPPMFGSAACVFFLRQFFAGVLDAMLDSGNIDGMNHIRIFFKIIVPLAVPAILAQAVLGFLAGYNDYLGPLLYIWEEPKYTLQLALQIFSSGTIKDLPVVMAGAVVALLPTIALYIFAQKYLVTGIAMSGLKG